MMKTPFVTKEQLDTIAAHLNVEEKNQRILKGMNAENA